MPNRSASSSVLLKVEVPLELEPVVYKIASPSAALSCNSRVASEVGVTLRACSARSKRLRYSSRKELWNQVGAEVAVSFTPSERSPSGEKHQSSAARTSSIRWPFPAVHSSGSQSRWSSSQLQHSRACRRLISALSWLSSSFSTAYA